MHGRQYLLLYCLRIADNLCDRSVFHRCFQLFIVEDKHLAGKSRKAGYSSC